jgi:transposase
VVKRWHANNCQFINGNKKPKNRSKFTPELTAYLSD